mgnify:CR=1 FL=1
MSKRPFDKELFKRSVVYNVKTLYRTPIEEATQHQIFQTALFSFPHVVSLTVIKCALTFFVLHLVHLQDDFFQTTLVLFARQIRTHQAKVQSPPALMSTPLHFHLLASQFYSESQPTYQNRSVSSLITQKKYLNSPFIIISKK